MDGVSASRVREEVPRVDPLGAWTNLVNGYTADHAHTVTLGHLEGSANRERSLDDARPDAGGILDQAAQFPMKRRLNKVVVDLLLHVLRGFLCLVHGRLDGFPGLLFSAQQSHIGYCQARDWRRLEQPCAVISRKQHVTDSCAGCIDVRPGDVQEDHRAGRCAACALPRLCPSLGLRYGPGVLILPVGVINALVVLFVFLPFDFDA